MKSMKSLSQTSLSALVLVGLLGTYVLASSPPSLNVASSNGENTPKKPFWSTIPPDLIAPLSRLKITSQVGLGGFGSVSIAEDVWPVKMADGTVRQEKGTVAVKCVTKSRSSEVVKGSSDWYGESAAQEFVIHRAAAEISTIVLPYAPAGDLEEMVTSAGRGMPESFAKTIVFYIARAIKKLGKHGIFHRDIKPNNIVLHSDYSPKLIDFGLATFLDERSPLARQFMYSGMHPYQAPETREYRTERMRLAFKLPKDRHSFELADSYVLGKTLQKLLTGREPFDRPDRKNAALAGAYDLIEWMTNEQPNDRCTIDQLLNHKWLANAKKHIKGDSTNPLEVLKKVVADDGASMDEVTRWLTDANVYDKMLK